MAPISGAQAGLWKLAVDKQSTQWERIQATNEDQSPQPRSYHTMTSVDVCVHSH